MNLVLDSLQTRRSFRGLGHLLGLLASCGALRLVTGLGWGRLALLGLGLAAGLGLVELAISLMDKGVRRMKALAPGAFPFKNLPDGDRDFLQAALLRQPRRAASRSALAWILGLLALAIGMAFADQDPAGIRLAAACFACLGLPVSAICAYFGTSAMGRRVAPFYYFHGGYADRLSDFLPTLRQRAFALAFAPMFVAVMLPLGLSQAGLWVGWQVWAWQLLWAALTLWGGLSVMDDVAIEPLKDLGMALSRFEEGDYTALLDVTSGDEIGQATERFNKALRAADRRMFVQENFGHMVPRSRSGELFEDALKLTGEEKTVAVLAVRLKGPYTLAAFNRLCQAFAESADKYGGGLDLVGDGIVTALFGAPLGVENLGSKALAAAWELKGVLEVFRTQQKMQKGLDLGWGMGLSLGPATVGLAGPKRRQRYTVLGAPEREALELSLKDGVFVGQALREASQPLYIIDGEGRLIAGPEPAKVELPGNSLGFEPGARL